jgi:hypothetical protein
MLVSFVCETCGKTCERDAAVVRRRGARFCDNRCYTQSRIGKKRTDYRRLAHVEQACPVCGKVFVPGTAKTEGVKQRYRKGQQFCSWECSHKAHYRRGSVCAELSPTDAAYLAGFFDGEGSFVILRGAHGSPNNTFRVTVSGSKESVIAWIAEVTGVGTRVYANLTAKNPKWAEKWTWTAQADAAESFTRQLLPYLKLKREQAQLGADFQERLRDPKLKADRTWQEEWRDRMQTMNRRGPVAVEETV